MAQAEMPLDQKRCSLGRLSFLAVAPCSPHGAGPGSGQSACWLVQQRARQ